MTEAEGHIVEVLDRETVSVRVVLTVGEGLALMQPEVLRELEMQVEVEGVAVLDMVPLLQALPDLVTVTVTVPEMVPVPKCVTEGEPVEVTKRLPLPERDVVMEAEGHSVEMVDREAVPMGVALTIGEGLSLM